METKTGPTYTMHWTALLAYLVITIGIVMAVNLVIEKMARIFGFVDLVDTGRRIDLGMILALMIGLPASHRIAKALSLTPERIKSQ